jgi:membrane protein DedA with SNARE-associated domain
VLEFIDKIAIPFLEGLYGAVGYLGVMIAMAIESAMVPLPSELILPFAGFLVSDPTQIEPLTGQPWSFWIVVVFATIGNTIGSLIAYTIGAYGGRPFLERYGRYVLIRPHEIEVADRFFERWGSETAFFSRLLPIVRTFISFPAGVARMNLVKFIAYSTAGAFLWSIMLVWSGTILGENWEDIRAILQPFDLAIALGVFIVAVALLWWRLGMPGYQRGVAAGVAAGVAGAPAVPDPADVDAADAAGTATEPGSAPAADAAGAVAADAVAEPEPEPELDPDGDPPPPRSGLEA